MDKELDCKDLGLNCDFKTCGETEEEVLSKVGQHVLAIHGSKGFSKEFYKKARSAVHDGYCKSGDTEEMQDECCDCYDECFTCGIECCC
jgi:predicted small metal-binding protein